MLQASRGKAADHKLGKEMAEAWAQLGSSVLPATDTTVHRVVENPIALWKVRYALGVCVGHNAVSRANFRRIPTIVKLRNHTKIMPSGRVGIGNADRLGALELA